MIHAECIKKWILEKRTVIDFNEIIAKSLIID